MALQEQSAAKAAASLLMRPDLIIILRFFDGKVNSKRNICLRSGKKFAHSSAGEGENARFSSKAGPLAVLSSITTVWDSFLQGGRLFGALSGLHIRRGGTVGRAWIVRFLSVRCAFRCSRSAVLLRRSRIPLRYMGTSGTPSPTADALPLPVGVEAIPCFAR